MITYTNITRHDNMPFDEYLKLPGYSFSFLKGERNGIALPVVETENIRIGKLVDAILTSPEDVDIMSPLYPMCKDIARRIKEKFPFIEHFKKQVSYTGKVSDGTFSMPVKGRLDYLFEASMNWVIDLKITKSKDVKALVEFMGYEKQLYHYCGLAGAQQAKLMIYSIPNKDASLLPYGKIPGQSSWKPETIAFWQEKIQMFGSVA